MTHISFNRSIVIGLVTFIVAMSALGYELLLGALGSYLFGDYVLLYSVTIGVFMFSLGIGSFLSKLIGNELETLYLIEILLAIIGGSSVYLMYHSYDVLGDWAFWLLLGLEVVIGIMAGLELPLLISLIKNWVSSKEAVAWLLFWDYMGGLVISVAFPLLLLPFLGFVATSFLLASLNLLALVVLMSAIGKVRYNLLFIILLGLIGSITAVGVSWGKRLEFKLERMIFDEPILALYQTRYQRITLTFDTDIGLTLFIDGNLQFASIDEYRYHEGLVHPAMWLARRTDRVLIIGGGDGLALREVLKYDAVDEVLLVDIDPEMVKLAKTNIFLRRLNRDAFSDPRVKVINEDAFEFLRNYTGTKFDVIIIDLPDPHNICLSKLYSDRFYIALRELMSPSGIGVTQATSPYETRKAFWCIVNTLSYSGYEVLPYHVPVMTFGDWGFVLFSISKLKLDNIESRVHQDLRYISPTLFKALTVFPKDEAYLEVEPNKFSKPVLYRYYESYRRAIIR